MKTILASIAAAGVLVVGAFAAGVITDSPATAQTVGPTVAEDGERVGPLEEVLDGLVADGTLSQAQADEVEARLRAAHEELKEERQERREERREERQERREERREDRAQIRDYLEDGVIDADELAELGDDHPFNDPDGPFADAVADGELTADELRSVVDELREERRGGDDA